MEEKNKSSRSRRYDEQFKKDTVEHWLSSKKKASEIAEAFDVSETTLYKQRKRYEFDEDESKKKVEVELSRLRKENSELRQD